MHKGCIILLIILFTLVGCSSPENPENFSRLSETEEAINIPEPDLLESWLGSYRQEGTWQNEIKGVFDLYIYQESGKYYGYLCVSDREAGISCYLNERIHTEIRGSHDRIEVYFLEKQQQLQGCYYEEYPEIFDVECGESKLDQAVSAYGNQDLLFSLKRNGTSFSVIEGKMLLGKNEEGMVYDFEKSSYLTMDNICEKDKEIFLKMFQEKEQLLENEQSDYSFYSEEGDLIVSLYLNSAQESGTGIYYGQTQISKYITQFNFDTWEGERWEDDTYSLIKEGEQAAVTLDEYQEYPEYDNQGHIRSFYSEGIVTGWGEPEKEKLVQIEFFYRDDGTLERKECRYNPHLYGTTRQYEIFYYNEETQLTYAIAYITHGMLSDYYFYIDGKSEPVFCLTLDHIGPMCYGSLKRYSIPDRKPVSPSAETEK